MRQFDWEDFRHFAALARTLNLGDAAEVLRTSQVTVMRRVKSLEAVLDVALFVRRRDGHRLTPAGTKLFELGREVEQVFGGVPAAVGFPNAKDQGDVRIATTEVGANWMLLPHVAAFRTRYPDITIEIDASPRVLDLLENTETLALRFHRPEAGPHVIRRLGSVPYGIYAAPRWLRTRGKGERRALTEQIPYIDWAGPFAEISVARWLRAVFEGKPPALALTTLHGHIEAARQGIGATALPLFVGRQIKDLVELQGDRPTLSLEAWLVVPAQIARIARIRAVVQFVEKAVRGTLDPIR